jgi:hypothetical protein
MSETHMTERERALKLAEQVLDSPNADPDSELMLLARQLQRSEQRCQRLEEEIRRTRTEERERNFRWW